MNWLSKEAGFLSGAQGPGAQVRFGKEETRRRNVKCAVFEKFPCSFVSHINFAQHFTVCRALSRFVRDLLRGRQGMPDINY